jgi:hypothetical protein
MTTKKVTTEAAVKETASETTHSKEEMLDVIDRLAKHVQELRDEVAGDKKPSITLFTLMCNENTLEVSSNIYGSGSDLLGLISSVIKRDKSLKNMFQMLSLIASL